MGISMALGPVVGGALVTSIGWRSVFWINVPIGIAALALSRRYIPESRAAHARRVDPVGQLLVVVLLAASTFAIIEGPSYGWTSARILGIAAVALTALAGIRVYEPRRHEPLVDTRFFRSAPFSGATVIAASAFAALGGFLFLNTLYLQDTRGLSALSAGIDTLPMALVGIVGAPISGRIVGARGARIPLVVGGAGLAGGSAMLAHVSTTTSFTWLFVAYVVFGIGFGVVNAPITNTAVSGMPRAQAGVAAGVASASRQLGQTLGVAVVGALAVAAVRGPFDAGFASASRGGWWTLSGCGLAIVVLGVATTSRWARKTAVETARRLTAEDAVAGQT
jgi:MFS family permease